MNVEPLDRITFDAAVLMRDYPPRWHHRNKSAVFQVACSSGFAFEGSITYTRWKEARIPDDLGSRGRFEIRKGVFEYLPNTDKTECEWHMNFADPHLFAAYGSSLLAQDELQVLEHPILGSVREALGSMGKHPRTVDELGRATPVTVSGVQRRCVIDTAPNPQAGRPGGLYGNAFARASVEAVLAATKPVGPPTLTNVLAIAAPVGGRGAYSRDEIDHILSTAYTGFRAAHLESQTIADPSVRTVINTGFWGCGAFGGNRVLMTILQALAADLANVDIKFYAFDQAGMSVAKQVLRLYEQIRADSASTSQLLNAVDRQGFTWGKSDGN